jgi:hypothetical protein
MFNPLRKRGSFFMTDSTPMDLNLVDQVVERIPPGTWPNVRIAIITNLVDCMPSNVLEQLTNDPEGFDKAEEILTGYYQDDQRNSNLIEDAFRILGEDTTLYLLDSLQLDKIEPIEVTE